MGPVGGSFQVQSGSSYILVQNVEVGSPAELAGLQSGDYIMGAFGENFSTTGGSTQGYKGAPQGFAQAIERAESSDGVMPLTVLRPSVGSVDITVNLPVVGAFGPAYPLGSTKFDGIYQQAAGKIHENIDGTTNGDVGYMTGFYGIVLLADPNWNDTTGAKPYRLSIDKMKGHAVAVLDAAIVNPVEATNVDGTPNDGSVEDSNPNDQSYVGVGLENWSLSVYAMFLAEYRAKTGDSSVDATVQRAADLLAGRIQTWQQPNNGPTKSGLMGHGGVTGDYPHISYAGMNIINAHAMTALAMLKNAGATIDDMKMQASWNWVKSCTNTDGNIGYGWKQGGYDSGGRTAGVAFAMSVYGGLDTADQEALTTMKDYVSREWQRMQHTHAYTAGGTQFYQFVLPYLPDRDQRFIMENQKVFYHFHRTTTDALQYFGGRENNGGDGYVNTGRVAYAGVAMAQAVASGNLTTIASIDSSRIHADFQSPFLTWPTLDARQVEIDTLSQDFTVGVTDFEGTGLVPADFTATWTNISGPAAASFSSTNTTNTSVTFPQDGTYRIQLEVVKGGYTLTEPIDVVVDTAGVTADPASIVTNPVPQTTTLGGSASFSVATTGDGPFIYEWFLDGTSLGVNRSATLSLNNVSGGQAGDYHCVVTHPAGTSTSTTAGLTISDAGILVQSGLWRDQFNGISGNAVSDLTNHVSYPRSPGSGSAMTSAESDRELADSYGSRWTGWLKPDVTGDYTFYIAVDDSAELWLSTDDQPSNKVLIKGLTYPVLSRDWDAGGASVTVSLTAGQNYYIEVLHKEGGGSDYCGIAWQKPGEGVPVNGAEPIPGEYFSHFSGGVQDSSVVMPPAFDDATYAWSLVETANTGTSLGSVSATDINTPISYVITAGNDEGTFSINSSTGEITLAAGLDFETTPSYALAIQATGSTGLIGQVEATVTINDIYDAQFVVNSSFESAEGFTGYSGHATLAATTDLQGNQWSTPNDARIWNSSSIPPAGVQCLTLGVAGNPSTAEVSIAGTDHGVSSVTFDYASFSSSTNVTFALSYRVDGGAWVQAWSDTVVGMALDWQVKPWTSATVDINQSGDVDLKLETTGTNGVLVDSFRVKDNQPNVAPVATDSTLTVAESSTGLSAGFVTATDENTGDPLSYAITGGNAGGPFAIDSVTGEITTATALDYTTLNQYVLTVTATDTLGLSDTATVTIDVTEVITELVATADAVAVQAGSISAPFTVMANDLVPTGQAGSVLGFYNSSANYDAGSAGTPADPTSAAGGTWVGSEGEDGDYTTGNVTGLPSIDDNGSGLDAWVVTDNSAGGSQWITYTKTPDVTDITKANANGWIFETNMRFVDDFGAGVSTVLIYGNGSTRFLVFFELDGNGDLVAQTFGTGGATYTLTTGGTGTQDFHNIQMVFDPATGKASFAVDDVRYDSGTWAGQGNSFTGVQWGNGSSGGKGSAAFNQVKWGYLDSSATLASGATASITNGELTFDPNGGYSALAAGESLDETLTYAITTPVGNSSVGNITVTVNGENEAPVVNDNSGSLAEDATIGAAVATITSSDVDTTDTITYAITAGNTGNAFAIDAGGNITTVAGLDFEAAASYALTVTATDGGGLSDTATVTVTVTNVNEAPTASDANGSIAENTSAGAAIATVSVTDPDAGDSVNYAITAGNTGNAFAIDTNGNITTATVFDFETTPSYALTVTATDGGGLSDTATVTVNVTNVNEGPSATGGVAGIAEDSSVGTAVTTVAVTDPDSADTFSYAITAGNTGGAFTVDTSGVVRTASALDFETTASYALTVTVTDAGGLSDTAAVTVNVTNINEAIVANDNSGTVAEDATVGSAVATVATSDPDSGDSVSFAITAGNTGNAFAIDTAGNITTATALDFETTPSYSLTVTATDGGGLSDTANVTVTVTNSNESPVFAADPINASNATEAVAYSDTLAGSASDVDAGSSLNYSKTTGPAWLVVASDGTLSGTPSNSDSGPNVFTVQVDDGSGGTDSATLNITVDAASGIIFSDDFERSAGSTIANGWIEETNDSRIYDTSQPATKMMISVSAGSPFAIVNQLTNTYVDGERYEVTWNAARATSANGTLVYDASIGTWDGTTFTPLANQAGSLNSLNILGKVAAPSVYTTATAAEDGQQIAIRFEVLAGSSDWAGFDDVAVNALGANVAPAWVANPTNKADANEDAPYTASLAADATDADAGDSVSFSKLTGPAWLTVATDGALSGTPSNDDVGANAFTVQITDQGGLTADVALNVTVVNENDAPVAIDSSSSLAENATIGAAVATVSASDVDAGDSLSYAITAGNTGNAFAIDNSGNITTATGLDFETTAGYSLTVTVTDSGALTDTATVPVTVTNVNEAIVANDNSGTLAEDATVGSAVATVTTSDPDAGDSVSFAITGGNTGNAFAIDTNGNITTATGLNYEAVSSYSLTVTATDGGGLSDTATVIVTITNANEAIVANDNNGTLAEDVTIGSAVATVTTSDPDAGDSVSFAITGGNTGNAFAIDTNGNITTATALDFETTASYSLTVTATDGGGYSDTATVTVTITDVVETTAPVVATGSASNLATTTADIGYSITGDGGEAPSVTLYYGETDGGTTPGSWTNNVAVGAKATGAYVESLTGLTEGTSYYFTIAATNSVATTWGSTGSFDTTADASPKMVRTTVNAVSSTNWTTVDLGQNYTSAVIVATPIYADSTQVPVVTRIRNVSGSSFDLKLDRADGLTADVTCDVSVIAVEEGVYTLANDGVQMEAVKYTSTITANRSGWNAEARTYQNSYTTPVVVGQVMSANDANWSTFWSMGSSRLNPADASNLNVGKHVAEDPNTTRANEVIGYIVIESGNGTINGVVYTAAVGSDIVRNYENSTSGYSYSLTGLTSASAAALSSAGMDGSDGAWPVLNGVDALSSTAVKLIVDEDQFQDSEQKHATEQINYIIFE